jgi:hypothetical protein
MTIWKLTIENEDYFVRAATVDEAKKAYPYAINPAIVEATSGEAKAFGDGEEQALAYVILDQLKRINEELDKFKTAVKA